MCLYKKEMKQNYLKVLTSWVSLLVFCLLKIRGTLIVRYNVYHCKRNLCNINLCI